MVEVEDWVDWEAVVVADAAAAPGPLAQPLLPLYPSEYYMGFDPAEKMVRMWTLMSMGWGMRLVELVYVILWILIGM